MGYIWGYIITHLLTFYYLPGTSKNCWKSTNWSKSMKVCLPGNSLWLFWDGCVKRSLWITWWVLFFQLLGFVESPVDSTWDFPHHLFTKLGRRFSWILSKQIYGLGLGIVGRYIKSSQGLLKWMLQTVSPPRLRNEFLSQQDEGTTDHWLIFPPKLHATSTYKNLTEEHCHVHYVDQVV